MQLKLTIHLHSEAKPRVVTTDHEGFGFNNMGMTYKDQDLGFPVTLLFTDLISFKAEGKTGDKEKLKSKVYQETKSDKRRKDTSGQWTV